MRIIYMGNYQIGQNIHDFLLGRGEDIVWCTVMGNKLPPNDEIVTLKPDIGVSIMYSHILNKETIEIFPKGVVNLHPALLPYCRGKYPALWAIVERKPAGVTLHYMDEGVDTGDIILQRYISYEDDDKCKDIYAYCQEVAGYSTFVLAWHYISCGANKRISQPHRKATFHLAKEVENPQKWFNMTVKEIRDEWGRN